MMMDRFIISDKPDKQYKQVGLNYELIDMQHESDGGPVAIAWFAEKEEAERALRVYRLPSRF
jgi:hypothetical protein